MSIHKRSTKHRGVVYDVRLRDPEGKPYKRTFPTKRKAEAFEAAERTDRSRGAWVDPRLSSMTFEAWSTDWLGSNPAKRSTAWARDESVIRLHLVPPLGDRPLGSITPRDVQALVSAWAKVRAPRSVRREYGTLRAILAAAVNADLLVRSPCRGIKLPAVKPTTVVAVGPDELDRLATALGPDYSAMAYLGVVLGLRWGEVAGLRVRRLDLLDGRLEVAEQLTRGRVGGMELGPPKSDAGRRTMSVPGALVDELAAHLARKGLTAADSDAFVFTAPEGGPLDYSHWRRRVWLPACETARLPGLHFHDLRKANATGMVAAGVDVKTAQARLGHTDPRLTLAIYAQVTSAADEAAAESLGDRFMPRARPARRGAR